MRMIASAAALFLGLLAAGCNGEVVGGGQRPARMVVVAGDLQTAPVGQELPQPLVVRVVDARNRPVKDQLVNFVVTAGGGSVFAGSALTNAQGEARERWRLGTVAGDTQRVEARAVDAATGQPLVFAVFRAVGTAGAPVALAAVGSTALTGLQLLPLADSVAVIVRDTYGNPVPGQAIAWSVLQGGGSASPASSVTSADGVARTSWTLGSQFEGTQALQAAAGVALTTQFTANVQVPAGAVLVKVSGDGQSGAVGQPLAQPLVVRVQHADGRPIAGIPVTFSLPAIYGSVTPASSVSDADGRVTVQWTLGAFPYGVEATASIPSAAAPVTFNAMSRPGPVAELRKAAGDAQTGRAGSVLADSLQVRAVDQFFNPVPGVTVTWSAPSGSVSPATAVTRADGTARTAFTLPAAAGQATAQASVSGAAAVTFAALATSSPVYMRILQPTPNAVRGDNLQVVVAIDSANASIASVVASAGGRTVTLQPAADPRTVTGTLSLTGTPVGPMELRVLATTVNGDTAAVTRTFIHDAPPSLSVTAPVRNTVARPQLRLDADCADDDPAGCVSLTVFASPLAGSGTQQIASGTTGVHTTVQLGGYDGEILLLSFRGTDSRGQTTVVNDTVFVESSAALTEIASAGAYLLDAEPDAGRVLFSDAAGSVWIRAGSTETRLATGVHPEIGRLHPNGAIFGNGHVYDWNSGVLNDLGTLNAQLEVDGSWAIWSNSGSLYRRDLNAASTALVSGNAINDRNDVTAAGGVVYASGAADDEADSYEIFRYDGAGTTPLTSDLDATYRNIYPVTDGTSVLFIKRNASSQEQIALWRGGTETVLSRPMFNLAPRRSYDANAGWIAWVNVDGGGIQQVYTRSPDGTDRQVTSTGTSSQLRGLGADGTVLYANGGWLYAIRAPYTGAATRIAHDWQGALRFVSGDLMLFLGRSVFRVSY